MKFLNVFVFLLFLFLNVAIGQPEEFHSCHQFKSSAHQHRSVTAEDLLTIQNSNARSDSFDIIDYRIELDVSNFAGKEIKGNTQITFVPKLNLLPSIRFDLLNMTIDSITFRGNTLRYTYDGAIINAIFDASVQQSVKDSITIYYHGKPNRDPVWGGFYFDGHYTYNLGIGISTIPPNFGKVWYPCFDSFIERATYAFIITSSATTKAYCVGTFLNEEQLPSGKFKRHYKMDVPITTYLSNIAVSDYTTYNFVHKGIFRDIPVQYVVRSPELTEMVNKFKRMGQVIDALEYWFGPYRFERVGYVATTVGAMEHPTNVAYPVTSFANSQQANEQLYGHELAHHWWGDIMTLDDAKDMWIKEGTAEYGSHLLFEYMDGRERFVNHIKTNLQRVITTAAQNDEGYFPLSPMPYEHIYGTTTYNKGATAIHNLRAYLGDTIFRKTMTAVFDSLYGTSVDAYALRDFWSRNSGIDLTHYFKDHIFSPGFTAFAVDSMYVSELSTSKKLIFDIGQYQHHTTHLFTNVPLEISVYNADKSQREQIKVQMSGRKQTFEMIVSSDFVPSIIILNEEQDLHLATLQNQIQITANGTINSSFTGLSLVANDFTRPSFMNIAHHYVGPKSSNQAHNVFEVSETHFWQVQSTDINGSRLSTTINYDGSNTYTLDVKTLLHSEDSIILVHREHSNAEWKEYPFYTKLALSKTDKKGLFRVSKLLTGDYAFAFGYSMPVSTVDETFNTAISINPNPVTHELNIHSDIELDIDEIQVISKDGKMLISNPHHNIAQTFTIDVSALLPDTYFLVISNKKTNKLAVKDFVKL